MIPLMPTKFSAIMMLLIRFSMSQMDVPARQTFLAISVNNDERSAAGGITNLVRSIGFAISPMIVGHLMKDPTNQMLFSSPFFIAGSTQTCIWCTPLSSISFNSLVRERTELAWREKVPEINDRSLTVEYSPFKMFMRTVDLGLSHHWRRTNVETSTDHWLTLSTGSSVCMARRHFGTFYFHLLARYVLVFTKLSFYPSICIRIAYTWVIARTQINSSSLLLLDKAIFFMSPTFFSYEKISTHECRRCKVKSYKARIWCFSIQ